MVEPTPESKPPNTIHPNNLPSNPGAELRQEEIVVDELENGASLTAPESPMATSPDLPPMKALPTPPDDETIDGHHPPSVTKPAEKPVVIQDVSKSSLSQPEFPSHPAPLRTAENPDLNPKTAPLPVPSTSIFTPHPPPTDMPGTRLMRKASAPQLQPNVPVLVRDPVSHPTPALPKRTSWLTKAREVHQEAKALTHTKRTEPHPGISESSTIITNHLTKRKTSEIFDGVELPLRRSFKVQKVAETDVQTNLTRESHDEKSEKEIGRAHV